MTKQAHFTNLPQILAEAIRSAKKEIHIAVCWFTLLELFEELLIQQRKGITVQFIINFDQLNFSPTGLSFEWQILNPPKPFVGYKMPTNPVTRLTGGGLAILDNLLRGAI